MIAPNTLGSKQRPLPHSYQRTSFVNQTPCRTLAAPQREQTHSNKLTISYIRLIRIYRRASLRDAKTTYPTKIMSAIPSKLRIALNVIIVTSFESHRHYVGGVHSVQLGLR